MITLLASAARTADGNSGSLSSKVPHPERIKRLTLTLDVTVAGTDAGDLLDVWLQTTHDGGTTWQDVLRFTQVLGNGGAKKHQAEWTRDVTPEAEMAAPTDITMAAGVTQGKVLGTDLRLKWTVTDVSTDDASFTFSVSGNVVRR